MPEDKWKLLYEYARKSLDEDIELFQLIDAKSEKFLTLVSAVFAILATVSGWAFQHLMPPGDLLTWALFLAIIFTFVCLGSSWCLLFRAIKLAKAPRMPLSDEVIELFWKYETPNIYYALTKACRGALRENRKLIDVKGALISKAYTDISLSAVLVAIDVALIVMIKFFQ